MTLIKYELELEKKYNFKFPQTNARPGHALKVRGATAEEIQKYESLKAENDREYEEKKRKDLEARKIDTTNEKLNEYYEFFTPEWKGASFRIRKKGETAQKSLFPKSKRPVIFTFGKSADPKMPIEECQKMKGWVVFGSGREAVKTLFPEWYEGEKEYFEDARTEKYLEAVKKNIGLLEKKADWERYIEGDIIGNADIWGNLTGSGMVDIGKDAEGRYVAEFSYRTDIDDYVIESYFFDRYPKKKDILTASKIDEIENWFDENGYDRARCQRCWECGHEFHWLDCSAGDLDRKWDRFLDSYCGCDEE